MITLERTDRLLLLIVGLAFLCGMRSGAWGTPNSPVPSVPDTLREEPRTLILDQPGAPVALTRYKADYDGVRLFQSDGVRHEIAFRNPGDRDIAAVKFRFVMYSVFNDVIEETDGVFLDPLPSGESESDSWTYDPPEASTFHVGAAYVSKVRFADGDLWEADAEMIEAQLSQIDRGNINDVGMD